MNELWFPAIKKGSKEKLKKTTRASTLCRKWIIPDKQEIDELEGEVSHKRKKRGTTRKSLGEIQNGPVEGVFSGMAHELLDEAIVEQNIIAMPTMSSPVVNSDGVEKSTGLPFAKCSPMWNSVESLEVFQKIPQRPHFSPLVKCSEDCREGLAIGHMVIFANLVERTSKLQPSDPQSIIDRNLVTLAELENHGFNVEVVRSRLNELQDLKFKLAHIEEEEKQVEAEIERLNLEKTGFDEVINLVEERMKQIQQKLAVTASMRDDKVEKIGGWKSKLDTVLQLKEGLKHDFARITDSML